MDLSRKTVTDQRFTTTHHPTQPLNTPATFHVAVLLVVKSHVILLQIILLTVIREHKPNIPLKGPISLKIHTLFNHKVGSSKNGPQVPLCLVQATLKKQNGDSKPNIMVSVILLYESRMHTLTSHRTRSTIVNKDIDIRGISKSSQWMKS